VLKVNVGLSRKLSQNYNSTGYSVNLEGEIALPMDDPEAVIEKIREYYDLADEALRDQIDRFESDNAIGSRDEEPPANSRQHQYGNGQGNSGNGHRQSSPSSGRQAQNGNHRDGELATNKQVQFLLTMAKRHKLSSNQLESRIAEIIGRSCGVYDLTKREAGLVLDDMTNDTSANGNNGNTNGRR